MLGIGCTSGVRLGLYDTDTACTRPSARPVACVLPMGLSRLVAVDRMGGQCIKGGHGCRWVCHHGCAFTGQHLMAVVWILPAWSATPPSRGSSFLKTCSQSWTPSLRYAQQIFGQVMAAEPCFRALLRCCGPADWAWWWCWLRAPQYSLALYALRDVSASACVCVCFCAPVHCAVCAAIECGRYVMCLS